MRRFAAGTWLGLFAVLTLCLSAPPVKGAQPSPPIAVSGTSVVLGGGMGYNGAGGGWFSGQAPLGGTFVVGLNGDVIVGDGYGGSANSGVFQITPGGTQTILANFTNSNAAGMDQYGNVYIARDYGSSIIKLPYNAATSEYVGFPATGTADNNIPSTNCMGGTQDTAPCVFASGSQSVFAGENGGFTSLFFDAQGDFFFATDTNPANNPNTIFECVASSLPTCSSPITVYIDPNPALGSVSADPWGNLFFSDGQSSSNKGNVTNIEELPLKNGAYGPVQLITSYTSAATYNAIGGVSANNLTTVYFSIPNDGVYAFPNSSAGPDPGAMYKVSNEGGKGLTLDRAGNLYTVNYSNTFSADAVWMTPMGNVGFGASPVGTPTAASTVNVFDSAGNCTSAPTLTFASTSDYVATAPATSSCQTALNSGSGAFTPAPAQTGAVYSVSIVFTPAQPGPRYSDLLIADAANNAAGAAAMNGVGQGAAANVDPGLTSTFSLSSGAATSVVSDLAGDVIVSASSGVYEYPAASNTPTAIGSGFVSPEALAFDANADLYIADAGVGLIKIANAGTPGIFTAGTQSTIIPITASIAGQTLGTLGGFAVGPSGTIYLSDTTNARVVYFNPITGQVGVTLATAANGLKAPAGIAVDSSSNLYVADSSLDEVFVFSPVNGISTVSVPTSMVIQAAGVAVDASGSLLIDDKSSGNIARIPNESGALTPADAIEVETLPAPASSLWMDSKGDLFAASPAKAAYEVNRSAVSINLGTVADGAQMTGNVYLMNSGNESAVLASPDLTQPAAAPMFTLAPGATNSCTPGAQGPAGESCTITAEFAPPAGSGDSGPYLDSTGAILVATPTLSIPVTISGTASVSSLQPQTITYNPALPTSGFVGQQIMLSATSTSGLTVTFAAVTPSACTLTGTTLTFTGVGNCIVNANQTGGQNGGQQWGAAPQLTSNIVLTSATPAGVPGLVMTQVTWLNPAGSFTDGQTPMGGSFAVTPNSEIFVGTTYSNKVYVVNTQTGATIGTPVSVNGPGGMTVDSSGNLYISHLYNNIIYKVPYISGAYVSWSDSPTPAPPACTGSDTAECTFVSYPSGAPNSGGLKAIAFDPSGNFYMVSEPDSSNTLTGESDIYVCSLSCIQANGAGVLLYADQYGVSQIAFDPWGNLFFTDANYDEVGTNNESNSGASSSALWEIPAASLASPPFTGTPTELQSFTNSPVCTNVKNCGYDDMLASVAVDPTSGTIYYGVLYDGLFAIPNSKTGGPQVASQYAVSSQGAKALEAGTDGNLYMDANTSGSDTVGFMAIGDMNAGTGPVLGTPVTASASVADNANGCNVTANLAFASSNSQFSANAGTTCSSIGMGDATLLNAIPNIGSYSATITFGPTSGGPQAATLSVSDLTNGGTGSASVSGTGQEIPQTIAFTAPAAGATYTYAPTLTVPITLTSTGASNTTTNLMQLAIDTSSTGQGSISTPVFSGGTWSATLTVTQAGSFTIDASQAGGPVNNIYYQAATQSLALTVNKAPETITFTPPASPVPYTPGLTATLVATGSGSTSPIVFSINASSSTGTGTISGNTLTVTQAGSFVIDADQAADPNYAQAATVSVVLVVNQATQTITVGPIATPLYYIASCSPITLCATVQITATGGATNNPVALSPDPSNAVQFTILSSSTTSGTTTAVIALVPSQNIAFPANLVIDANQQGNANYAAATQVKVSASVGAPLPVQSITWANPGTQVVGTPITLNATASSGFAVVYTSTTTSVCTVSGAAVTLVAAGDCTIVATQPGDNKTYAPAIPVTQTFIVNATGQVPGMSVNLSLGSLTIQPGTVGTSSITLTSENNFTGSVVFSCSGLPSGYYCTFSPLGSSTNPLLLNAGSTAVTTLSVSTTSSASLERGPRPFVPLATLAAALCLIGFKKRNRLFLILLIALSVTGLTMFSGCGGTASTTTKSTTSTATLTATSGATTTSATFQVTLN